MRLLTPSSETNVVSCSKSDDSPATMGLLFLVRFERFYLLGGSYRVLKEGGGGFGEQLDEAPKVGLIC